MSFLAIAGSVQRASVNAAIVRAARAVAPELTWTTFERLAEVPAFTGEDGTPPVVAELRACASAANGILIATPEYAHSVPGVLKNALDWLVGSGELACKPVAIVSASSTQLGGIRALMALADTLLAQSAEIVALLTIPAVKAKIDHEGALIDAATLRRLRETVAALTEAAVTHGSTRLA